MELLEGITKRNNRKKLYLLLSILLFVFISLNMFYYNKVIENQENLFKMINELPQINNLNNISLELNKEINSDLCILNDEVITCNKVIYNNYLIFGKYNLEFDEINNNVSYKIIENNKNIYVKIFEIIILLVLTLFISYYILKLFYFIKNKFNPYLKDEYDKLREEWSDLQKKRIELEELLSKGDKSVKEKLEELRKKEKKLEEEYEKVRKQEKETFREIKDDWLENKEFDSEERKKIYRKLSKYFHPDAGNVLGDDDFKNINEAYNNKDDTILFDYYKEYLEYIGEETNPFEKQSVTESMVLVQLVNLGLYPKPQHKISKMQVDLAFLKEKLIVEIDGPHHNTKEQKEIDAKRDSFLRKNGWIVKRYPVNEKLTPETAMNIARKIKRELIKLKK